MCHLVIGIIVNVRLDFINNNNDNNGILMISDTFNCTFMDVYPFLMNTFN